jgi:hypothetical protein
MSIERMRVWSADEDGCVQWWVVARSEQEARDLLRRYEIPSEDTEDFALEPVPDEQPFTLSCEDDYEGELPEGAEIGRKGAWQTVRATAGAWAALAGDEPYYLAGTEW